MENDHIFLRASSNFQDLSTSAENSLRKLNFEFIQNRTKELAEFEIARPVYFRVVVEKRKDPEVSSNIFLPSIKEARGAVLDIWFVPEHSTEERKTATACAREFLKALVSDLKTPPWEGLRFRESGKEKKKWKDLTG